MTLQEIRRIQGLVARAHYALTPLAADGKGQDGHGGQIADCERVLANACNDVRMAAAVVEEIETIRANGNANAS